MKKKSFKKTNLVKGVLMAALAFCGSAVYASDFSDESWLDEALSEEVALTPFTEVDYKAMFAKLPEQERGEAETLLTEIDAIYDAIPDTFDEDPDMGFSDETEKQLLEKEDRLADILKASNVDLVTVNLLDSLTPEQRERAEQLWDEIDSAAQAGDQKISDQDIENKINELDAILDSVQS